MKILGTITIWAIVIIAIYAWSTNHNNSVTVYMRICSQDNVTEGNCTSWILSESTYYVNPYTGQVMYEGDYGPEPFLGCSVIDKKNWSCDAMKGSLTNDGQETLGEKDGTFVQGDKVFAYQDLNFLSYWYYKISP